MNEGLSFFNKIINIQLISSRTSSRILHPLRISFVLMVNGGEILMALFSQSRKNKMSPFSSQRLTTCCTSTADDSIGASKSPFPLIS